MGSAGTCNYHGSPKRKCQEVCLRSPTSSNRQAPVSQNILREGWKKPRRSASAAAARHPGFGGPPPGPRGARRPAGPAPSRPGALGPGRVGCRNSVLDPPPLKTFWEGGSETRFERGVQKDKRPIFRLQKKVLVVEYGAVLLIGQNH